MRIFLLNYRVSLCTVPYKSFSALFYAYSVSSNVTPTIKPLISSPIHVCFSNAPITYITTVQSSFTTLIQLRSLHCSGLHYINLSFRHSFRLLSLAITHSIYPIHSLEVLTTLCTIYNALSAIPS